MDNLAIARILREIADLLEIKDDNPFKIRAYRNGADIAANHPHELATLDEAGLREIPGIGKDLAGRIREIGETGDTAYHRELIAEFPPTILDLLHLQGVGPKTVATLYRELGIRTIEDLERAALDGRVRALRGMGAKKEALILKALDERKRFAGRHLLPDAHDAAAALVSYLRERAPAAAIEPVGSLRRGCDTCGDLDLLASGAPASLMDDFVEYRLVERVLGHGETKSSVLIQGGFQADLRLVAADSRGAALQYFTGSKAHNIALRDRAIGQGFKLNEYGLFRIADDVRVAGEREEEIYAALGLDWIAPELREMRGELDAAGSHALPRLIDLADLRGDLHMHSTETDGKDDVRTMAGAAREAGLEYIAITDHTQSLAMANGLDERRALEHAARIRAHRCGGSRHPAARRRRVRHQAGRLARSRGRLPRRARPGDCLGPLRVHPGPAADDRPSAACDRAPARRHPRPCHRTADPEAPGLRRRHGGGGRRGGAARRRHRDQLPGRSARRQRRPREARARSRRGASSSRATAIPATRSAGCAGA